jgi:hypothetical protein
MKQSWSISDALVQRVNEHVCGAQARVLQHVCKDLCQSNPSVCIVKHAFACLVVPLANVRGKRQLLTDKQEQESAQYSRGAIDARVSSLAEEVQHTCRPSECLVQLIDNSAEQHRLAVARIAFNPQQLAV